MADGPRSFLAKGFPELRMIAASVIPEERDKQFQYCGYDFDGSWEDGDLTWFLWGAL